MYYTIEGKRVLGILYIAGLITGTLFFNITMKMQIFKLSDFLDFTEYMKMLENIDLSTFCSYVFFVRFRQLMLFFIGLFLFSPYIVFCLLDYITSIFIGILLSVIGFCPYSTITLPCSRRASPSRMRWGSRRRAVWSARRKPYPCRPPPRR